MSTLLVDFHQSSATLNKDPCTAPQQRRTMESQWPHVGPWRVGVRPLLQLPTRHSSAEC